MSKLKIALLCNNKMAGPAMMSLAGDGVLCGIATADKDREVVHIFREEARKLGVPYCCATYGGYKEQLQQWLHDTEADVVFVMTFPWRIPPTILAMPRLGFLNFHYGLLPEMRGADPIFEGIRQRMPVAGVTVHVMDEGLDTGPVVLREEVALPAEFTYGLLSGQLARMGAQMAQKVAASPGLPQGEEVLRTVEREVEHGERGAGSGGKWNGWPLMVQDEARAKYWPKVGEEALTLNWNEMDSGAVMALVRACNPIAKGVPTSINGWKLGVCDVNEVNLEGVTTAIVPGTIVCLDMQNGLIVYCKNGKGVKLEVIYTAEGVFPGYKLGFFGIACGMVFS